MVKWNHKISTQEQWTTNKKTEGKRDGVDERDTG